MSTTLETGHRINLEKTAPGLKRVRIGLGWKVNAADGQPFDLDSSVFLCKKNAADDPVMISNAHFVYYNQTTSPDGAVVHSGDNRTGDKDGDDEVITVDLTRVQADVVELPIIVTIHDAEARKQNFGMVSKAFIRCVNANGNAELARYDLSEDGSTEAAMIFGEVYRAGADWKFKAIGQGFKGGLGPLAKNYGVNV